MTDVDAAGVVRELHRKPRPVVDAIKPAIEGGLPAEPGFYAWWTSPGSIPDVPTQPHPYDEAFELFYVGISPSSASSQGTIRSRVLTNHLGGNLGSSTFRLTLAAFLREDLELHPTATKTKVVLPKAENDALSRWQRAHLALTWCVVPEPWKLEPDVIAAMLPPLNVAVNAGSPFAATVSAKRAALRAAARGASA